MHKILFSIGLSALVVWPVAGICTEPESGFIYRQSSFNWKFGYMPYVRDVHSNTLEEFDSPLEACQTLVPMAYKKEKKYWALIPDGFGVDQDPVCLQPPNMSTLRVVRSPAGEQKYRCIVEPKNPAAECKYLYGNKGIWTPGISLEGLGKGCSAGKSLNHDTGMCESETQVLERKMMGPPPQALACEANSGVVGNPISFAAGNKFQVEEDLTHHDFSFVRYYNSLTGGWTDSYMPMLLVNNIPGVGVEVSFRAKDGRSVMFRGKSAAVIQPETGAKERLMRTDAGWSLIDAENTRYTFDEAGALTAVKELGKGIKHIAVEPAPLSDGVVLVVTDSYGHTVRIQRNSAGDLVSISTPSRRLNYDYDRRAGKLLSVSETLAVSDEGSVTWPESPSMIRRYEYKGNLLTAVYDAGNKLVARWKYDAQNRPTQSERAGGIDRYQIAYEPDGTVKVTNPLGKVAAYEFETRNQKRVIASITGEPSPNCMLSNTRFEYDDNGHASRIINAEGGVTTIFHDDRGRPTLRTEGEGDQQRTTKITWDRVWNLPKSIVRDTSITNYKYDADGNLIRLSVVDAPPAGQVN